jgi:Xaa-Pro aminopeptidase
MKDIFKFLPEDAKCFIISTADEFLLEYSPPHSRRLEFITKFTGSNGIAVICKNGKSFFFTDGRYLLQASKELNLEEFEVPIDIANFKDFARKNFKEVYFDPKIHSFSFIKSLKEEGIELKEILNENPIDQLWKDRPSQKEVKTYDFKLAGETREKKLQKVIQHLKEQEADALFIFDQTEVAWLLNTRGDYLQNTPISNFFVIVSRETGKHEIVRYEEIEKKIKFPKIILPKNISVHIVNVLSKTCGKVIFDKHDFILNLKSVKTESEIECIRKAHIEDGKALSQFLEWVKKSFNSKNPEKGTEFTLGKKLFECRSKAKGFKGESFETICGFAENGAIIHYRAEEKNAKSIEGRGLLLIDSGGQYYDENLGICGTTDVTRVISIGAPTPEEKYNYTLVLKGHIALATAIFPEGTTGGGLDILARQFLFQNGMNYAHGTGHGVGYFLGVHEGPASISKYSNVPLKEGMIISNEPGFYLEGKYGIRIESLLLVKKSSAFDNFLEFETLTKVPPEKELLDFSILSDGEIEWLVNYQKDIDQIGSSI